MEKYPGAAVDPVLLPQNLYAPAFASASVTPPVEALFVANVPSPVNELTPAPVAEIVGPKRPRVMEMLAPAVSGRSPQVSSHTLPAGSASTIVPARLQECRFRWS